MYIGKNTTVKELKDRLQKLCDEGKQDMPIGLVSNNHSCEGDRDRLTISECHFDFVGESRKYVVIGN